MKYIELFKNGFDSTIDEKTKPENYPYVGYSPIEGLMLTEILKEEEIDPTAGFVDLGLSVMWASCDVGTTSPEGEGSKYPWGELSWETIPLEFDPVYMNSDMELKWKEALQPRTPSPTQVKELLDNTTATEEVLNGVSGVRYTASNGNSIFVSNVERWTNAFRYLKNPYSFSEAACWKPDEGIIDNTCAGNPSFAIQTMKTYQYPFRGVCSNLPQGSAEFLKRGTTMTIQPEQLYCFPKTWTATQMLAATSQSVSVYISNIADVEVGDENILMSRPAFLESSHRAVYLSSKELANLAAQATDDYLYVRFSCDTSTELSINTWEASECADKSILLIPNTPYLIEPNTSMVVYRVRYADFSDYPLTIKWDSTNRLYIFISNICDYDLTNNNPVLLINPRPSITAGIDYAIDAPTVNSWASRISEEGYFYVRCKANSRGAVMLVTEKPEGADSVSAALTT